jgi:hypothetical protein
MSHIPLKYMKTAACALTLSAAFTLALPPAHSEEPVAVNEIAVGRFTGETGQGGLPDGWKPFTFPKKDRLTEYMVVREGGEGFVKAVSARSASAIYREVGADPKEFPYLAWRWKVDGTLKNEAEGKKEGDDFPARVYVTFEGDPAAASYIDRLKRRLFGAFLGKKLPGNAINYVWAGKLGKNTSFRSPYTDCVAVVAIESGDSAAGQWVAEERNVYEDYRNFFKSDPPKVLAVVIMTDTDNTGSSATAYYADIVFRRDSPVPDAFHAVRVEK